MQHASDTNRKDKAQKAVRREKFKGNFSEKTMLNTNHLTKLDFSHLSEEEINEEMEEFLKPVPVPVPKEMMEKLQIKTYNSEMGFDKCSVCFEKFLDSKIIKSKVRELACGHIYHIECVDEWLKKHPTCPVCSADQRDLLKTSYS